MNRKKLLVTNNNKNSVSEIFLLKIYLALCSLINYRERKRGDSTYPDRRIDPRSAEILLFQSLCLLFPVLFNLVELIFCRFSCLYLRSAASVLTYDFITNRKKESENLLSNDGKANETVLNMEFKVLK